MEGIEISNENALEVSRFIKHSGGQRGKARTSSINEKIVDKDAKAQTYLVAGMNEQLMLHIISCNTSAKMCQKLASVYKQKGKTSIHII